MQIHQLLMGRDVALDHGNPVQMMAASMANFTYVVEHEPGKAFLVDPAWDVDGVLEFTKSKGLSVTCAVFTHRHLDHTGGRVNLAQRKVVVPGLLECVQKSIPVKVGKEDVEATVKQTGASANSIQALNDGDEIVSGATCLHTPGHTPGSICVLINDGDALLTGDTLFIGSCGRVDLAESDPQAMMSSLARLAALPQTCRVLPGHNYASLTTSTIGRERQTNFFMRDALSQLSPNATSARGSVRSSSLPDYLASAKRALDEDRH